MSTKLINFISQVLAEYEKTISELIGEKEKEQQRFDEDKSRLKTERDQVKRLRVKCKGNINCLMENHRVYTFRFSVCHRFSSNRKLKKIVLTLKKKRNSYNQIANIIAQNIKRFSAILTI